MPIYEFGCGKCGHEFEELVRDNTQPACPKCGSMDTKKLMSACARHRSGGASVGEWSSPRSSGGGCAGCSGGNCASCGS